MSAFILSMCCRVILQAVCQIHNIIIMNENRSEGLICQGRRSEWCTTLTDKLMNGTVNIVAYLFKVRNVKPEKQPLLGDARTQL
jgi:hypothetical protein